MCSVAVIIESLSAKDNDLLVRAFANPAATTSAIRRALVEMGYPVGDHTVRRHRNNECACAR